MGEDHNYRLSDNIGTGSYGDCFIGHCQNTTHTCDDVAVKLCTSTRADDIQRFRNEAAMMRRLERSNNVIDVVADVHTGSSGSLPYSLELGIGDLDNYSPTLSSISFEDKLRHAIEICTGIADAHAADIVHRDMHYKNVIMTRAEESVVAKINDFGKGKDYTELDLLSNGLNLGAQMVWSPESLFNTSELDEMNRYIKVDIYSAGLVLNYLFTGLFPTQYMVELVSSIERFFRSNNVSSLPTLPPRVSPTYDDSERKQLYEAWLSQVSVPVDALLRVDLPTEDQTVEEGLNAILVKATRWDYNERYDSMNELIEELRQCLPQS